MPAVAVPRATAVIAVRKTFPAVGDMLPTVAPTTPPNATLGIVCTVATMLLVGPISENVTVRMLAESSAVPTKKGKKSDRWVANTRLAAPIDKMADMMPQIIPARTKVAKRVIAPPRSASLSTCRPREAVNRASPKIPVQPWARRRLLIGTRSDIKANW